MNRVDQIILLIAEEASEHPSGDDTRDLYSVYMEISSRLGLLMVEINRQKV